MFSVIIEESFNLPYSVILTEKASIKYFGQQDPIGKTFLLDGRYDMQVTGVVKSINHKSHLEFNILAPMSLLKEVMWKNWDGFESGWDYSWANTYIVLSNQNSPQNFTSQLNKYIKVNLPKDVLTEYGGLTFGLQSVTDIHLAGINKEIKAGGSYSSLMALGVIALLLLCMSCMNFINLNTARSITRAKEVSVKKTFGSTRKQLVVQFLLETWIQLIISIILAICITYLVLPTFNQLFDGTFYLEDFSLMVLVSSLVIFSIIFSIISGFYPALVLSGFTPRMVLSSKSGNNNHNGVNLRKILVVLQFVAATGLIACGFVINNQIKFIQTKELGINSNEVILINRPAQSIKNEVILSEFTKLSQVISASASAGSLPGYSPSNWSYHPQGLPKERKSYYTLYGFDELQSVLDIEIISGEGFTSRFSGDTIIAIILNEAAVKDLGWTNENAIGKQFDVFNWNNDTTKTGRVVGVAKNFHFQSLHEKINPLVLSYTDNDFGYVTLKVFGTDLRNTLQALENTWDQLMPDISFRYTFLNEKIDQMYKKEVRFADILNLFSGLALVITGLGLIGLLSFMMNLKTKEISLRKILGASFLQILILLSTDLLKLIAIAIIISFPISYYFMNDWLNGFAFRVPLDYLPFIFSSIVISTICFLLVYIMSRNTIRLNPAETLKEE